MCQRKRLVVTIAEMLSLAFMLCAGCQRSPQRVPPEDNLLRTAGKATVQKPQPSDASTPELPQDFAELEKAIQADKASEGAAPDNVDQPAVQESEEAMAGAQAEKPVASQETPSVPSERSESLIRDGFGSHARSSPSDESAEDRSEGKSGPGRSAAAEKTDLPSEATEQPVDAGKGDGASEVRDKKGSMETPQGLEKDREADSPRQPQEPEPSVEEEFPSRVPAPEPGAAGDEHSGGESEPAGQVAGDAGTGASSLLQDELKAAPRRQSAVAMAEIPGLPAPPPADTRDRPKGIVQAPKGKPDKPAEVRGSWRQTREDNSPDFLAGGYASSILVFRPEGILEVQRTFGKDGAILLTWEVGYKWNKKKSILTLGEEAEFRPPPQSLKGFKAGEVAVKAAVRRFPVALPCVRADDGTIRLGKKVYVPVKEAGKKPAPDKGQSKKKAPSSGGASDQD